MWDNDICRLLLFTEVDIDEYHSLFVVCGVISNFHDMGSPEFVDGRPWMDAVCCDYLIHHAFKIWQSLLCLCLQLQYCHG